MILGEDKWLLFTGRHFWNRKCRKKTWWQQEFAVFKCEATANSVTGHVCVNSNVNLLQKNRYKRKDRYPPEISWTDIHLFLFYLLRIVDILKSILITPIPL